MTNRQLLQPVLNILKNDDSNFRYNTYIRDFNGVYFEDLVDWGASHNECGTTACVAGHLVLQNLQVCKLIADSDLEDKSIDYDYLACRLLGFDSTKGLNSRVANMLFHGYSFFPVHEFSMFKGSPHTYEVEEAKLRIEIFKMIPDHWLEHDRPKLEAKPNQEHVASNITELATMIVNSFGPMGHLAVLSLLYEYSTYEQLVSYYKQYVPEDVKLFITRVQQLLNKFYEDNDSGPDSKYTQPLDCNLYYGRYTTNCFNINDLCPGILSDNRCIETNLVIDFASL